MRLDLNSLRKGVESLERTLGVAKDEGFMSRLTDDQGDAVRAGVIQNFEFTYELCWKFIRRWLEVNLGAADAEGITRRELFRLGAEYRLITDVDCWMEYHEARNETAHTYDEDTAEGVFETSRKFIADAKKLLQALEARND